MISAPSWPSVELSTLVVAERGISYGIVQPGVPVADGVPIIRVSDVRGGRIATSSPLRVSHEIERAYRRTRLKGGELLVTIVGTVGETAIVPAELAGWNVARAIAVLPIREDVGAYWVQLGMRSADAAALIQSRLNTTVQATLNLGDLAKLPILLPPPNERERIRAIIGALDEKIDLNRRMNETLEAMARTIFKDWFVDFGPTRAKIEGRKPYIAADVWPLFPQSLDAGGLPAGWMPGPLLDHARLISGGTPKTDEAAYWNGRILWASAKDISQCGTTFLIGTERSITERGLQESAARMLPKAATVVVARGATTGRFTMIGRAMAMNQTCYGLASTNERPFWLNCAFKNGVEKLIHAAHGSVFDTITTSTFESARFVNPGSRLLD